MSDLVRDLLLHMAWADARLFHAWGKAPQAHDDAELRQRASHATGTQAFFLEVLQGTHDLPWERILKGEVRPPWLDQPLRTFEDLRAWSRDLHGAFGAFLATSPDPGRTVRIPWFPDPPCVVGVGEALVQVAMHTQHHRGQNATRLKQAGGKPLDSDYLIWLWKGRPEARWD